VRDAIRRVMNPRNRPDGHSKKRFGLSEDVDGGSFPSARMNFGLERDVTGCVKSMKRFLSGGGERFRGRGVGCARRSGLFVRRRIARRGDARPVRRRVAKKRSLLCARSPAGSPGRRAGIILSASIVAPSLRSNPSRPLLDETDHQSFAFRSRRLFSRGVFRHPSVRRRVLGWSLGWPLSRPPRSWGRRRRPGPRRRRPRPCRPCPGRRRGPPPRPGTSWR
jgi:hypothetical protein